mgnify:CR=1 FL=1
MRRYARKIRKDLKANGASTTAQVSARFRTDERLVSRRLWRLTKGIGHVSASGALDNPATTYTWVGL